MPNLPPSYSARTFRSKSSPLHNNTIAFDPATGAMVVYPPLAMPEWTNAEPQHLSPEEWSRQFDIAWKAINEYQCEVRTRTWTQQ